jgi:erythromycin esterase
MRIAVAAFLLLFTGSAQAQSEASFMDWARQYAVSFTKDDNAFRTLDSGIVRARLIGVGESVHESAPFAEFRRRLLQDLVRRHRVTALVLESGMPEVMAVDDYVLGRKASIDYDAALPGLGEIDEIRATVEWLREWNRSEGRKRPVRVYGADLSGRSGSMLPALDHLEKLTAGDSATKAIIDRIRPVATQLSSRWFRPAQQKYDALTAETKSALAIDVSLLADRVAHLAGASESAQRLALLLERNEEGLRLGTYTAIAPRDHALAENTLWIVSRLPAGERAVYWAHNAHVQKALIHGGPLPPGKYLGSGLRFATALGIAYYAIGTAYGGPALDDGSAPSPESVDEALQRVSASSFVLPLTAPRTAAADAWLTRERPMRFQTGYLSLPLAAFDAVVYFDKASRVTK